MHSVLILAVLSHVASAQAPSGYRKVGVNCNCGAWIQRWNSGKGTAELCATECSANSNCVAFGVWNNGNCILFDTACTDTNGWLAGTTCPNPTGSSYPNTGYNKATPTRDPTLDPTSDPLFEPTADPVWVPTNDPLFEPTADPVYVPTTDPLYEPTADPFYIPTWDPHYEPTADPVFVPTTDPLGADSDVDPNAPSTTGYRQAGRNCNCGTRIAQYGNREKDSVELCAAACSANSNCKAFALWDEGGLSAGYCALFNAACTDTNGWLAGNTCPNPTARGYPNTGYNKIAPSGYAHVGVNCNCGARIQEFGNRQKDTVNACAAACSANRNCRSFALWDEDSPSAGYCALFNAACTYTDGWWQDGNTCPNPTARGYGNTGFNRLSGFAANSGPLHWIVDDGKSARNEVWNSLSWKELLMFCSLAVNVMLLSCVCCRDALFKAGRDRKGRGYVDVAVDADAEDAYEAKAEEVEDLKA
jgi:hypothetical protein